jgi:hypothetical protein
MHKFLPLAAGISLLFASCQTQQRSRTWEVVKATPHPGPGEKDPSGAYATKLHKALEKSGVEHKVVTFKFRYVSRLTLNHEGEDTVVIYRDGANAAQPWWIMAERLWSPMWLPASAIDSQVSFFVRRPASVVKVEEFPAASETKSRKPEPREKPRTPKERQSAKKPGNTPRPKAPATTDAVASKRKLVRIPLSVPPPVLIGPVSPAAPSPESNPEPAEELVPKPNPEPSSDL